METWLPVVGWIGIYEVSDHGRVRRVAHGRGTVSGRVMVPTRMPAGYLVVRLRFNGRTEQRLVHSLVCAAFIGPRPKGYEINHLNGVKSDNRPVNLAYCTSSENKYHAYEVLKRPLVSCAGVRNGRAKLTEEQVIEIRRRYANGGVSQQALADEFGMSQPVVSQIIRKTAWSLI